MIEEHLLAKQMLKLFATNLLQYKTNVTHLSAKYLSNVEALNDKIKQLQRNTIHHIVKQTQILLLQWQTVIDAKNIQQWNNLINQLNTKDEDYRISYDTTTKNAVQSYLTTYPHEVSLNTYQQWVDTEQIEMPKLQGDILHYFTWLEKFETTLIKLAQ